jgi:hypothetical protein
LIPKESNAASETQVFVKSEAIWILFFILGPLAFGLAVAVLIWLIERFL